MKRFHAAVSLTAAIGMACVVTAARAELVSNLVSVREILAHCSTNRSAPDDYCIGYMESALDFITNYQVWLSLNRYDFPPGERPGCPVDARGQDLTAVALVNALRDYVGKKGQNILSEPGIRVLPKVLAEGVCLSSSQVICRSSSQG